MSVNILPYFVFEQFKLGELKLTEITLQLVDWSVRIVKGVIEDMLITIDDFIYPMNFVS